MHGMVNSLIIIIIPNTIKHDIQNGIIHTHFENPHIKLKVTKIKHTLDLLPQNGKLLAK